MKKLVLPLLILSIIFLATICTNAQNVGIGTTAPDSTAMLDIKSSSKGFLMPRMTMTQRLAIPNPADGLQVFQTDTLQGVYTYLNLYQSWFIQTVQKDIAPVMNQFKVNYPDTAQYFIVPKGVRTIKITANGAAGGIGVKQRNFPSTVPGGNGLSVSGLLNVNPGDSIIIKIGARGFNNIGGLPYGISGVAVNYVEYFPGPFGGWLGFSETITPGGGGGSASIYLNQTSPANLIVKSVGGNGGTYPPYTWYAWQSYTTGGSVSFPAGAGGGPQFIAASIQNPVVSSNTSDSASVTIEWFTPSYIIAGNGGGTSQGAGTTAIANTNTTGLLSSADWNTFSNKIGGNGNTNELAFFNGTKTVASAVGLKWDNANTRLDVNNIKVNSLSGATTQLIAADSTGKLILSSFSPSGDNMGNHTAFQTINLNNNFISNNGIKFGLRMDNNGYAGIGLDSTVTTFSAPLTVNSLNNGSGITNWIASNVGGKTGSRVISGLFNGMATIGAHNYALSAWNDLKISPFGNVAIGDITPLVKLDVNGILRATNIGIGTTTPQRALDVRGDIAQGMWTDNIPRRRIGVMDNTLQVAGMEIENTTLGGNYSQKLHLLTHHYGASTDRRLTIDEDGNVGIGIQIPTNKLSVAGNANITGTLSTTGNTTISGLLTANSITATGNISTTTNANITGTLTAGNVTTTGTVSAGNVSTTNITSSKFKVTEIWNNVPGLPPVTNFTSGGGTLLLNISSMAFQTTGIPAGLTIQVFIDGVNITNLKGFASQNSSQIPLTVSFKVITGFSPGNHTISLVTVSPTSMDSNSYTSASILELPF
jgi:hypothetical protein